MNAITTKSGIDQMDPTQITFSHPHKVPIRMNPRKPSTIHCHLCCKTFLIFSPL